MADRLIIELFNKLPAAGSFWAAEDRRTWLDAMRLAIDLVYGPMAVPAPQWGDRVDAIEEAPVPLAPEAAPRSARKGRSWTPAQRAVQRDLMNRMREEGIIRPRGAPAAATTPAPSAAKPTPATAPPEPLRPQLSEKLGDREAITKFIAERGVTKGPPRFAARSEQHRG